MKKKVSIKKRSNNEKKITPRLAKYIQEKAGEIITEEYQQQVLSAAKAKVKELHMRIPEAMGGRIRASERVYCKFNTAQLLAIFGGWFTLNYAFTVPYTNNNGTESEMDFYICSQDLSETPKNERPPLNKPLKKAFGIEIYGFAIIAPESAFM